MLTLGFLVLSVAVLAATNGANDNFKGVATVHGSGVLGYRPALGLATAATFLGSLAALWLAGGLLERFSGKGLVPDAVASSPGFVVAVALGAGLTILLATRVGFPISTTHALIGALVDRLHLLSAAAVSFARGLNDTPKIAALLMAGPLVAPGHGVALVAIAMAGGALLGARRVAHTMSREITAMSPGQGFAGNIATAGMVLGASWIALPVSTTHVSCGALFGIGVATGQARWPMIRQIVLAWVVTLPVGAALASVVAWMLPAAL